MPQLLLEKQILLQEYGNQKHFQVRLVIMDFIYNLKIVVH